MPTPYRKDLNMQHEHNPNHSYTQEVEVTEQFDGPLPWFRGYIKESRKVQRNLTTADGRGVLGTLLWLMTRMSESPRRGYLLDDFGKPITVKALAKELNSRPSYLQDDLRVLNELGIVLVDELETLFSPQMVADEKLSGIRRDAVNHR